MLGMIVPVGETDLKHSHTDETVYFITGGKAQVTLGNGD